MTMQLGIYGFTQTGLSSKVRCKCAVFLSFSVIVYHVIGKFLIKSLTRRLNLGSVTAYRDEVLKKCIEESEQRANDLIYGIRRDRYLRFVDWGVVERLMNVQVRRSQRSLPNHIKYFPVNDGLSVVSEVTLNGARRGVEADALAVAERESRLERASLQLKYMQDIRYRFIMVLRGLFRQKLDANIITLDTYTYQLNACDLALVDLRAQAMSAA